MVGVGRGAFPADMVNDIAGRVDGMAVLAQSVPDSVLEHVSRRIPIVLIAGPRRGDNYDHVSVSNAEGMGALTTHLLEAKSVTDFAYLAGPDDSPDGAERFAGFREALQSHGVDPDAGDAQPAGGSQAAAHLVAAAG